MGKKMSHRPKSWDGKLMDKKYHVSNKSGKAWEKTKKGYKWVGYG